jgi:hypothetical protein
MNLAAGIRFSGKPAGFITAWNAEGFFVGYDEFSPTKQQPFSGGSGMYLNARMEAKAGSLSAGYWDASKFISPTGMPVFQSLSQQINYPGYTERQRKLLFLRYAYQKQLVPHFWLDFRVEPVFDLGLNKRMDFYHSLFLVYRQEFRLVK